MRTRILLVTAMAALLPFALQAAPPKKVFLDVSPKPRPALKSDASPDIPLDLSKAMPGKALNGLPSTQQQLGTLNAEIARDKPALAGAKQKSDQLSAQAADLRQKLVATAARVENLEQENVTLGDEIVGLEEQDTALTQGFERDRISVTRLLAILERLQHDTPPALAVRPDDALAAARGAMLVGASLPPVYAEATRLAHRIDALRATRVSLVKRRAEAVTTAAQLTKARADLETLTAQKEAEAEQAGGTYEALKDRLGVIASQAADFQALVNRVAQLRKSGPGDSGIVTVTATNTGSLGPLTKGSLLPPVVGTIQAMAGPTSNASESAKNPGITYVTQANAQVIAPSDGRVLFAGPYHKSGQVLILEITTGYDLVLAGLGRVTVRPNDELLAGEPVGSMPVGNAPVGSMPAQSGSTVERLYFELRQNGHGLDPRPWLSLELRKAKGT